MSKPRDVRDYIQDILGSAVNIQDYILGMTQEQFLEDKKTRDAVVRNLEIIGEATNKIPQHIRDKHAKIPWHEIIAMRNKLAHEYFGIDFEILWQTLHEDLAPLVSAVQEIATELGANS